MDSETKCGRCGGAVSFRDATVRPTERGLVHETLADCVDALRARLAAAEARAGEAVKAEENWRDACYEARREREEQANEVKAERAAHDVTRESLAALDTQFARATVERDEATAKAEHAMAIADGKIATCDRLHDALAASRAEAERLRGERDALRSGLAMAYEVLDLVLRVDALAAWACEADDGGDSVADWVRNARSGARALLNAEPAALAPATEGT